LTKEVVNSAEKNIKLEKLKLVLPEKTNEQLLALLDVL